MKIKIFTNINKTKLEQAVNEFLETSVFLEDLLYSTVSNNNITHYSVLIKYTGF